MDTTILYQTFHDYITQVEGVEIQKEEEYRMLFFQKDGLNYSFIAYSEKQYYYFRLILPRIEKVNDDVYKKMDAFNRKFKVGKAFSFQDQVWLSFEHFVVKPDSEGPMYFARALSVLKTMIRDWRQMSPEEIVEETDSSEKKENDD